MQHPFYTLHRGRDKRQPVAPAPSFAFFVECEQILRNCQTRSTRYNVRSHRSDPDGCITACTECETGNVLRTLPGKLAYFMFNDAQMAKTPKA